MPNDRITYFECTYELVNNTAMDEAVFSSTSASSYSDISTLVDEPVPYNYMTLEHNFSILDGSLEEFPDSFTTPFVSSEMSDLNGTFTNPVVISITFPRPQNFYGLTLNFEGDYPDEVEVELYDAIGKRNVLTFNPDTKNYVAPMTAIDITSLKITFTKAFSARYIKLINMVFGQTLIWGENEVSNGTLLLETDMISDKISINTLDFTVVDKNNSYNLANEEGMHVYLQKKQEAYAYEYVNDQKIFLGKYFLQSFSWDNNLVKLNCVSYIGLLDDIQYNDGDMYSGTLAGTLIEDILATAGIDEYVIDTETYNTPVYGTIKPSTCRDALREILFACGSTAGSTTTEGITIYKTYDYILDTVYRRNKFNTKITRNDYVYGVDVRYRSYVLNTSTTETIVNGEEYLAGEHTIIFSDAYDNVIITAGTDTITPSVVKKYYCIFTLENDSVITITGNKYEEFEITVRATNSYIEAGETNTIKEYNTTLCNSKTASAKAKKILDYLQFRLTLDIQALAFDINIDGRRWVENPSKEYADFISWYTQRSLNLTGGFIDTAKLVGYHYYDYGYYYGRENTIDMELYSGESVGNI